MCKNSYLQNSYRLTDKTEGLGQKWSHKYHGLSWRYAQGLVDPQLMSAIQLPGIMGCIQWHLRKTYFYTCESGGKESSVLKKKKTLQATGIQGCSSFSCDRKRGILITTADSWSHWAFCVNSKCLIYEIVVNQHKLN